MRSHLRNSGHGGRSGTRLRSLGAFVLLALVTALRPAPTAAQGSFILTGDAGGSGAAPGAALADIANGVREAGWGLRVGVAFDAAAVTVVSRADGMTTIAASALGIADRLVGTRYRWGGDSPAEGFDCSGFVRYVFRQHDITLPRVARDQARAGDERPASLDGLAPGDLLFFAQRGPTVDHVAIYAGEGRIVHASRSGYGVRYDELTGDRGRWYAERLVAVRRVLDDAAVAPTAAAEAPTDSIQ